MNTSIVSIVFPFLPPSVNRCYRTTRDKVYKSKLYTDYEKQMKTFLSERMDLVDLKITGKVKLEITFYKKGARQFDIDNRLKSFIDSIEHVLIEDDNNVHELVVRKHNHSLENKTLLVITPIEHSV
jgi:Holliday junction resolvase RusA-like endonuclease